MDGRSYSAGRLAQRGKLRVRQDRLNPGLELFAHRARPASRAGGARALERFEVRPTARRARASIATVQRYVDRPDIAPDGLAGVRRIDRASRPLPDDLIDQ